MSLSFANFATAASHVAWSMILRLGRWTTTGGRSGVAGIDLYLPRPSYTPVFRPQGHTPVYLMQRRMWRMWSILTGVPFTRVTWGNFSRFSFHQRAIEHIDLPAMKRAKTSFTTSAAGGSITTTRFGVGPLPS